MQPPQTSDQDTLAQFLTEGVWRRQEIAENLITSLLERRSPRSPIEIEIYRQYLLSLDDILNWYYLLRGWRPNLAPLPVMINEIQVQARYRRGQMAAEVLETAGHDLEALAYRLNQPIMGLGWTPTRVAEHRAGLDAALSRVILAAKERILYGGAPVRTTERLKGLGILAEESFLDTQVVIIPTTGNGPEALSEEEPYMVVCDPRPLSQIVGSIKTNCAILATILFAFYHGQYSS